MLAYQKGAKSTQYTPNYIVFDLETTGISWKTDKIVELSAIKVRNGRQAEEFSTLINPERSIPYQASRVNGITDDMVKHAPTFAQVLPRFLEFIGNDVLVGHNIHNFDMKFLYRECETMYGKTLDNDYIDTLTLAKMRLPQLTHHKLTDLADYFQISTDGAHRALNDCRMNQTVYELLNKNTESQKICPRCGEFLVLRNGKFGKFFGCMAYPNCRYTENA